MVIRHAKAPYSDFFLLFHMALFFIASGYLYNSKYALNKSSALEYCKRKFKGLYVPYIKYTAAFILLNNVFISLNIYTDNKDFLLYQIGNGNELSSYYNFSSTIKELLKAVVFRTGTQIGGALWFFQTLFMVLIIYNIVEFVLNKFFASKSGILIFQSVIGIALYMFGYYCHITNKAFNGLNRVCTVYCLIHIGRVIKEHDIMSKLATKTLERICSVIGCIVLFLGYHRGQIALDQNITENFIYFIAMSLAGWILVYGIADFISNYDTKVGKCLIYISQHSVPIVALHFLSFKIVNYIIVLIYGMENYMVASFPVLSETGLWWLLYLILGICVPLIFEKVMVKIKGILMS